MKFNIVRIFCSEASSSSRRCSNSTALEVNSSFKLKWWKNWSGTEKRSSLFTFDTHLWSLDISSRQDVWLADRSFSLLSSREVRRLLQRHCEIRTEDLSKVSREEKREEKVKKSSSDTQSLLWSLPWLVVDQSKCCLSCLVVFVFVWGRILFDWTVVRDVHASYHFPYSIKTNAIDLDERQTTN